MSLDRGEYYAQPRNAFWPIMGRLFDAGPEVPYPQRVRRLIDREVAVWDVCAAASRAGSLDAAIVHASVVPNDFGTFLERHPEVTQIFFNGAKAAALYQRLVLPALGEERKIEFVTLPSTSPAHAAMGLEEKLRRWRVVQHARLPRPRRSP